MKHCRCIGVLWLDGWVGGCGDNPCVLLVCVGGIPLAL